MTHRRDDGGPASPGRGALGWGIGMGVGLGCLIAFAFQVLIPVLATLPGLVLCGGDELELVIRRRTSYGVCGGDAKRVVSYGNVLLVSSLVWSLVCIPPGIALARWSTGKARRR